MAAWDETTNWVMARGRELSFVAVGIVPVAPMDPAPLRAWLSAGYHAEMAYLQRHLPLRADLQAVLPGARTVICAALPYPGPTPDESPIGAVARYARGADYHEVVAARLQRLWEEIHAHYPEASARVFVDSGPLPERELARRAGLGWIGHHGCLVTEAHGSRVFLGEILTTAPLAPSPRPETDPREAACAACGRCLRACPTGALVAPGVVDARRCLSYLTIEHKGPIPRALRPLVGARLFGCDTCQDACPHNRGMGQGDVAFALAADLLAPDLTAILALTPVAFNARFRGTPIARAKRRGLLRNACIVLGNLGERACIPALRVALHDAEPLVRGHAAWALGRLGDAETLRAALSAEADTWVREEILAAGNAGGEVI